MIPTVAIMIGEQVVVNTSVNMRVPTMVVITRIRMITTTMIHTKLRYPLLPRNAPVSKIPVGNVPIPISATQLCPQNEADNDC